MFKQAIAYNEYKCYACNEKIEVGSMLVHDTDSPFRVTFHPGCVPQEKAKKVSWLARAKKWWSEVAVHVFRKKRVREIAAAYERAENMRFHDALIRVLYLIELDLYRMADEIQDINSPAKDYRTDIEDTEDEQK